MSCLRVASVSFLPMFYLLDIGFGVGIFIGWERSLARYMMR